MAYLSLLAWCKAHGVTYSHAVKLFERGEIDGAFREGRSIKVPDTTIPETKSTVQCLACGRAMKQISVRHLELCSGIKSFQEYFTKYPGAEIVAKHVKDDLRDKYKGIPKSEVTKKKMSESHQKSRPKKK